MEEGGREPCNQSWGVNAWEAAGRVPKKQIYQGTQQYRAERSEIRIAKRCLHPMSMAALSMAAERKDRSAVLPVDGGQRN